MVFAVYGNIQCETKYSAGQTGGLKKEKVNRCNSIMNSCIEFELYLLFIM